MANIIEQLDKTICPSFANANLGTWLQKIYTKFAEYDGDYATDATALSTSRALVNELRTKFATNKTAIDANKTLVNELRTKFATNKSTLTSVYTMLTELKADSATNYTAVSELKAAFLTHNVKTTTLAKSAAKYATSTTADYCISGVFYSAAATSGAFTTADNITASATTGAERVYVIQIATTGALSHVAGTAATGAPGIASIPSPAAGRATLGYLRIRLDAGAATGFIGGTTTLGATQINTATFTNVKYLSAWIGAHAPALTASAIASPATAITATSVPTAATSITSAAMSTPSSALASSALPSLNIDESAVSW